MAKQTRKASAAASLPEAKGIPEGFTRVKTGRPPAWNPTEPGTTIMGSVLGEIETVEFEERKKVKGKWVNETKSRRVFELVTDEGDRHGIWESAALEGLFEDLGDNADGARLWIQFDGLGQAKKGQNAPKLFSVARA